MALPSQWQKVQSKGVRCQAHTQQAFGQIKSC